MKLIDKVYSQLKQDVYLAKYKPNELITERQIVEKYGVSKVTAGEALHRLCSEGHLTAYPRSGYMVTSLTPREMEQLKRVRIAVESLVVDIVCAEASDESIRTLYDQIEDNFSNEDNASAQNSKFHMSLARLTEDKFTISLIETLLGSASRVEQYVEPDKHMKWQDYHRGIVDALLERNGQKAKARLIEDINQR